MGNLKNLLEMGHRRIYKGGYEVEIVGKNVVLRETSWNSQKGDFDRVVQEFSGIEEVLEVVVELGFDDWVVSELCECWICENILGQDEQGNISASGCANRHSLNQRNGRKASLQRMAALVLMR